MSEIKERKKIAEKLGYVPEHIITNVPTAWFQKEHISFEAYLNFYMGMNSVEDRVFYHFISSIPKFDILDVYIIWDKKVQVKARVAQFIKNGMIELPNNHGGMNKYGPRNWMVTCGPVVKAPEEIAMSGFQGFRYTKPLF